MDKIAKKDNLIIKELKVKEIRRLICNTNNGALELVIRKGETKYFLTLDSVPLEKEQNDILMDILFPVKPEIQQVAKDASITTKKVIKLIKEGKPIPTKIK